MDHRGVVARRLAVSGSRCHRVAVDRYCWANFSRRKGFKAI